METVSFTCHREEVWKRGKRTGETVGCGHKEQRRLSQAEIDGLFGPHPTTSDKCPNCGHSMSFSIPSVTRSVNRAIFG